MSSTCFEHRGSTVGTASQAGVHLQSSSVGHPPFTFREITTKLLTSIPAAERPAADTNRILPQSRTFAIEECQGWVRSTHPQGSIHFRKGYSQCACRQGQNIVVLTRASVVSGEIRDAVDDCVRYFLGKIVRQALSDDVELVLQFPNEKPKEVQYYLVDHNSKCLFWLEEFKVGNICESWEVMEVQGAQRDRQLEKLMHVEYWNHCSLFPFAQRNIPSRELDYLRDRLLYSCTSRILCRESSLPFDEAEASRLLEVVSHVQLPSLLSTTSAEAWAIGTMMHQLALHELSHVYGETKWHTEYGTVRALDVALMVLEFLSLMASSMYTEAIEKMMMGRIISTSRWTKFVEKLCMDQGKYMLIATVLLTANLALLATPDIGNLSIAQGFSKASIIASVACVAAGFLPMRLGWTNSQPHFNLPSQYWCFVFLCSLPVATLSHAFVYFCYGVIFMIIGDQHSGIVVILAFGIPAITVILLFNAISSFVFHEQCAPAPGFTPAVVKTGSWHYSTPQIPWKSKRKQNRSHTLHGLGAA